MPHLVNIQFHKKTAVQEIALYTDFRLDESYTPSKISIRAGTCLADLQEIQMMELEEPTGWVSLPTTRTVVISTPIFVRLRCSARDSE
jgi:anaphase-promoting complex subunit 10